MNALHPPHSLCACRVPGGPVRYCDGVNWILCGPSGRSITSPFRLRTKGVESLVASWAKEVPTLREFHCHRSVSCLSFRSSPPSLPRLTRPWSREWCNGAELGDRHMGHRITLHLLVGPTYELSTLIDQPDSPNLLVSTNLLTLILQHARTAVFPSYRPLRGDTRTLPSTKHDPARLPFESLPLESHVALPATLQCQQGLLWCSSPARRHLVRALSSIGRTMSSTSVPCRSV